MGEPLFVINGFYMSMREKFTLADAKIQYFVVEWAADSCSWEDFRGKVLGATDPATAEDGALRKTILDKWEELGLKSLPNVGDNGVHASASPFEAMCERLNWLSVPLEDDPFAQAMLGAGIPKETIEAWTKDPQVDIGGGKKGSLFDALEDMNSSDCLAKAAGLAGATGEMAPLPTNTAFVFIKPHAVTEPTIALVKKTLDGEKVFEVAMISGGIGIYEGKQGFTIKKEGTLDGPTIGEKKLIDNHYYAIANKASLTLPKDLNPPEEKQKEFNEKFGISWPDALAQDKVFNALDACTKMGLSGDQMDTAWGWAKKAGSLVKFGGGFYAGFVNPADAAAI
jgi:nucleoside diphosphate kinase